jgi:hypothetical protein
MWHAWDTREINIGFWWEILKEKYYWEDPEVDGRILFKLIFKK